MQIMSNSVSLVVKWTIYCVDLDKLLLYFYPKGHCLIHETHHFHSIRPNAIMRFICSVAMVYMRASKNAQHKRKLQNGPVTITGTMRISFLSIMTAFFYTSPRSDNQKEKDLLASDGGFYYYYGKSDRTDSGTIIRFMRYNVIIAR